MGGFGSGHYYRSSNAATTEASKRIDIRWLKKKGFLNPGTNGTLSWNRGGEPTGWIRFSTFDNRIDLKYRIQFYGNEEWQDVSESVWFDKTACNYGGQRTWFICPHCGKRAAVLYGEQRLFLCRKCSNLVYSSQHESALDRLSRKAKKIEQRLADGDTGEICGKPKGMHWRTYHRLRQADNRLQDRIEQGFFAKYRYWM